jgi:O-antigen ligase
VTSPQHDLRFIGTVVVVSVSMGILATWSPWASWGLIGCLLGIVTLQISIRHPQVAIFGFLLASVCGMAIGKASAAPNVYDAAGLVVALTYFSRLASRQTEGGLSRSFLILPFYAAMASLACLAVLDITLLPFSFLRALRLLYPVIAALLAREVLRTDRAITTILRVMLGAAALHALFAIVDFFAGLPVPWARAEQFIYVTTPIRYRAQGLFGESSALAHLMLFALVTLAAAPKDVIKRRRALGYASLYIVAILLTFSRTALSLLVLSMLMTFSRRILDRRWRFRALALTALGTTLIIAFPIVRDAVSFRLTQTFSSESAQYASSGRSSQWVTILNASTDPIFWPFGHGYKTLAYSDFVFSTQGYVDNNYLSTFYETGVVGVALVGLFFVKGWRVASHSRRSSLPSIAWIASSVSVWLPLQLLSMFTGDTLTYFHTLGAWMLIHGLLPPLVSIGDGKSKEGLVVVNSMTAHKEDVNRRSIRNSRRTASHTVGD